MNQYPQDCHGWLRWLCIMVHGCGIGLLALCASISSTVDPPVALLHPYVQAFKVAFVIQCIVMLVLFAFDRRLALWSLGIIVSIAVILLLIPIAIKES